jgi:hypothetical protein
VPTPRFYEDEIYADLWADPNLFAATNGISTLEATKLVGEASWVMHELTGGRFHGPGCFIDTYAGVRCLVDLRHGLVEAVSSASWVTSCGSTETPIDDFCVVGPRTVRVCGGSGSGLMCGDRFLKITYQQASNRPPGATRVVESLAKQYLLAAQGDRACKLPDRVQSITRQGVSWTILDPQDFLEKGLVGINAIDHWLNATRGGRPNAVRPRVIDPLRGRFVSSQRVDCSVGTAFNAGFGAGFN